MYGQQGHNHGRQESSVVELPEVVNGVYPDAKQNPEEHQCTGSVNHNRCRDEQEGASEVLHISDSNDSSRRALDIEQP